MGVIPLSIFDYFPYHLGLVYKRILERMMASLSFLDIITILWVIPGERVTRQNTQS